MFRILKDAVVSGPLGPKVPRRAIAFVFSLFLCGTIVVSLFLTSVLTPLADKVIAAAERQQSPSIGRLASR